MKQEFVDLGLPSGTLWGKRNVYAYKRRHFTHSKAVEIARDLHCKLPSKENFEELINLCKWKWIKLFGKVTGYKVTGPNGNYIFLPAAGSYSGVLLHDVESYGRYWSTTCFSSDIAYYLFFSNSNKNMYCYSRYCDLSIRLIKR